MAYPYGNYGGYNPSQPIFGQGMGNYPPSPSMPPAQPQQPQGGQNVRFVTSREQADVFQIPFDGSTTYFVDTSNGKIYTKAFDFNTGMAPIVTYSREQEVRVQYATIEDINALRAEIEAIKPKKAVKKSDADE